MPIETDENILFVLSISEANQYFRNSRALKGTDVPRSWWLRSPGADFEYPIAYVLVDIDAFVHSARADEQIYFRPALWVADSVHSQKH